MVVVVRQQQPPLVLVSDAVLLLPLLLTLLLAFRTKSEQAARQEDQKVMIEYTIMKKIKVGHRQWRCHLLQQQQLLAGLIHHETENGAVSIEVGVEASLGLMAF